jgi:glutathione-regulated potassium-efflux system ancillary protein KefC
MSIDQLLFALAVMMAVTSVAISLAMRLNLGTIAALLAVGIILGPHSPMPLLTIHLGDLQALGEIGVMLLIFIVGLETQPSKLWSMRTLVFGFGSLEYLVTSVAIAGFLLAVSKINWPSAVMLGLGLAMSSSAVSLPIIEARGEAASAHGRVAIAADILQSLMLIPVLALIPLLANTPQSVSNITPTFKALQVCAAVAGVVVLGHIVLPYALRSIARNAGSGAFGLLVLSGVCWAAWIMGKVGVSMALGAFLMGVLLSTSVYSTEIRAAVIPARRVLLGVFFVAVGMAIDLKEAAAFRAELLFYVTVVLFIKFAVVYWIARVFRVDRYAALLSGLLLMPLDEIGYVIFASAHEHRLLTDRAYALALLSISGSFLISPIAIQLGFRTAPRLCPPASTSLHRPDNESLT